MKRNGFRQQLIRLTPYTKIHLGLRAMLAIAFAVTGGYAFALLCLLVPVFPGMTSFMGIVPSIDVDTTGLEGDNKKFMEDLKSRLKFKEGEKIDKDSIVADVRASFDSILNKDGKLKFDAQKLLELIGEDEKGVRSMITKLGGDLKALQEEIQSKGTKKGMDFRAAFDAMLEKNKDKIDSILVNREGEIKFDIRAAVPMTTDSVIDTTAIPDDVLESFSVKSFVAKRQPREYVFDLASRTTQANVPKYIVWDEEGDEEGAFAVIDEGELKPLISYDLVKNISTVKKAAGKQVYTEEVPKFRANAYNIIRRLISQKVLRDYAAILTTDLLAAAAPYVSSALDGQYANATDYHAIAAVAAQIEALDFMPDMLILNPQDKWRIGMSQDAEGRFYMPIPSGDPTAAPRMMGFNVRSSNRVPVGTFILGESGLWEIVEEAVSIRIGYGATVVGGTSNGGGNVTDVKPDFDHNTFRIIAEVFFHNFIATPNAGSFVVAEFAVVKEAVESEG